MNRALFTILTGIFLATGVSADPPRDREGRPKPGADFFATMIRGLDTNKDRSISFEEFAAGERVKQLPEEHQRRLFDRFDKDSDGAITRDEIPRGPGEHPGRPFDPNRDGKVTFEEFRKNPRLAKMPEERLKALFAKMDRDGDGIIGPKDWKGRRPGGGPGRPPGHGGHGLASLDKDGDGKVTFEEFKAGPRMKDRPEEARREAFDKLDRNDSGVLEREEWRLMGHRPDGKRPGGKGPGKGPRPGGGQGERRGEPGG